MDPRVAAELAAHDGADEELVDALFRLVLRREPEPEARERALAPARRRDALAGDARPRARDERGVPARARARRRRRARARGARARASGSGGCRRRPARTSVSWRSPGCSRASARPVACSRSATRSRSLRISQGFCVRVSTSSGSISPIGTSRHGDRAGGRALASVPGRLVRPGPPRLDARARRGRQHRLRARRRESRRALRERRHCASSLASSAKDGSLLVTVPLGEPGDHGWFRQDDEPGWTSLFARAGLFVEELEAYELTAEGWRAAPSFGPTGVRYGERGPAASAVLCAELSPGRLRRLLTPGGARTATRRRAARTYRRRSAARPRVSRDGLRPDVRSARDPDARAGVRRDRDRPARRRTGIASIASPTSSSRSSRSSGSWASASRRSTAARAPTSCRTSSSSRSSRAPTQAWGSPSRCTRARRRCRSSTFGTRRAARSLRTSARAGEALGAFALTEPGAGSDAGSLRTICDAGRRRLGAERLEAVDHERLARRHARPLRAHRSGHRRRARRLLLRPRRRPRAGHARGGEARPELVDDLGPRARGRPRRARPPAPRGGARIPRRDGHARRRPHRDRRAGARDRPGRLRRRARRTRRSDSSSAGGSATSRRSSGSSRTWPPRSTRRACSSTAPHG